MLLPIVRSTIIFIAGSFLYALMLFIIIDGDKKLSLYIFLPLNRSFIEDSQAGIKISPQDNNYYGQNDRLVMLTGTFDEQMRAIELIVSKLAEDPHYAQSMNSPFSYPGQYHISIQRNIHCPFVDFVSVLSMFM